MSDELELETEEPTHPCAFCVGTGQILSGWDEDGVEIYDACYECDGDGIK